MKRKPCRGDQLKCYIIYKVQQAYGTDAVSRLISEPDGLALYVYTSGDKGKMHTMAHLEQIFPAKHFDDDGNIHANGVLYQHVPNYGLENEQTYKVNFIGGLTELADSVEKRDAAAFRCAQKNHAAQQIQRREAACDHAKGGL